jgi:hypothetical protein
MILLPQAEGQMSQAGLDTKTDDLSAKERTLLFIFAPVCFMAVIISLGTPIPDGRESREAASAFLRELFPDREVAPTKESTAPVAVLFHLIRSAEPEVARRVIAFAARSRFGHAAPYVIERLGSGDAELEAAAQQCLRQIAGADYGPDADGWRAWWRNPPRNLLGLVVGQRTFTIAVPLTMGLIGVLLLYLGAQRSLSAASFFGGLSLAFLWFNVLILAGVRLVAKQHVCTFGESRIAYYTKKGDVVGLEDARFVGEWFVFVWVAAFVIGPLLLVWAYFAIRQFFAPQHAAAFDRAGNSKDADAAPL